MVNKPTHIFESLTNHLYIKKALMEKFFSNVTTENIFFFQIMSCDNSVDSQINA